MTTDLKLCSIKGCLRGQDHLALCDTHYHRTRRGIPLDIPLRTGTPDRIVDLLETEGGWLTKYAIADRLELKTNTAQKALYRLRADGRVVSRPAPWSAHPVINEWRLSW